MTREEAKLIVENILIIEAFANGKPIYAPFIDFILGRIKQMYNFMFT